MRKAREDGAHFVEGERSPVGLNPGSVDSVRLRRGGERQCRERGREPPGAGASKSDSHRSESM